MDEVRFTDKPAGMWIGNVFYSDVLANRFLENMVKRAALDASSDEMLPCDSER
jgi:hypothetical protein